MAVSDINALSNLWYQPALSSSVNGHPSGLHSDALGFVVTDIDDIEQCIRIILETVRGSVPHRPLFGATVYQYIDAPINEARPHVVREVFQALRAWEPRIDVIKVTLTPSDVAAMLCEVTWQPANEEGRQLIANLLLGSAQ